MRKYVIRFLAMVTMMSILFFYPLNYYVSKPGSAFALSPIVKVEEEHEPSEGTFHLMTISVAKATPLTYIYGQVSKEMEVLPATSVKQDDEDDEEYSIRQRRLMFNSQNEAKVVAFNRAKRPYTMMEDGIYVIGVVKGSPAYGVVRPGDHIVAVDQQKIDEAHPLSDYLDQKLKGDEIVLTVNRDDEVLQLSLQLQELPHQKGRVGIGIRYERNVIVETEPVVHVESGSIGGPSAGLMLTLEMIDQLTKEDLTKGYNVAGTGSIEEDGTVGRIGGVDFKVIAAHKQGMDIFFAPDDIITEEMAKKYEGIRSNYEVAKETAERINTKMKIVPVRTIDDALRYLEQLPSK